MKPKDNAVDQLSAQTAVREDYPDHRVTSYPLTLEAVRNRAHEIGRERGGILGNDLDDWIQAWRELSERQVW